ncbi:DNA (cytosine-5-)-methyltransferase [Microbacterium laevaniformans]|uniref:DNA (cytosine-5-)-methyltransferase n=1 Tax=Microbacterium laevaniformans TaxID=36807 RepID=A0A4S2DG14_9MICO|nr:DNA (cytosine-5-)-methyltransferase [Microbacterium laevaniformans]TGY39674.1 DNA (cytosine-5-)-methyltransferase [Microbacterium laevaniformans]
MNGSREDERAPDSRAWRAAEFFAGIGLAGAGLAAAGIEVAWANDISKTKFEMFRRHFGEASAERYLVGDLGDVQPDSLPTDVDLAWASFPCTDLSVAGGRAGLHKGIASSTFWHFIKAISKLGDARPAVIALENVTAFATSHSGRDIASAIKSLNGLGYTIDVLSIDAKRFLPQSRPRLFLVGSLYPVESTTEPNDARPDWLSPIFDDPSLRTHRMALPQLPQSTTTTLADIARLVPEGDARWWDASRVAEYESSLSPHQLARYESLRDESALTIRTAYRRMRGGVPRWEMRNDEIAGCLRTSRGGSSKQAVVELGRGCVRIRWMTPVEYAALMGAPDFTLSETPAHHAYSGFGDAVCTPVVDWLARNYLISLLEASRCAVESDQSLESVAS